MTSSKILNWTTRVKRRGHCHFAFCCNILHILCVQVFGVLKLSCEPMLNLWYYDFVFFLASEKKLSLAKILISGSKITWPPLPTWKFVLCFRFFFVCLFLLLETESYCRAPVGLEAPSLVVPPAQSLLGLQAWVTLWASTFVGVNMGTSFLGTHPFLC